MIKKTSFRLTLDQGAAEFSIDRRTLARGISESNATPGEDGKYSILQCHRACAGDLEAEKIRETRHRANILELEEGEKKSELISYESAKGVGERVFLAVKAGILSSSLLPDEKDDLLKQLQPLIGNSWKQPKA
jgi:hypothetical protein